MTAYDAASLLLAGALLLYLIDRAMALGERVVGRLEAAHERGLERLARSDAARARRALAPSSTPCGTIHHGAPSSR